MASKRKRMLEHYAALLKDDSAGEQNADDERAVGATRKKNKSKKAKKREKKQQVEAAAATEQQAAAPVKPVKPAAKPGRRKAPEVIEFDDPTAKIGTMTQFEKKQKGRFMSAAVGKIFTKVVEVLPNENDSDDANDMELNSLTQDVLRLGASQMATKDRRKWETKQMVDLGARGPKRSKMPITMLNGMRAKTKERAERKKQYDIQSGMYRKPGAGANAPPEKKSRGVGTRWKDNSTLDDKRFKNGVLKVTRS